jgi:hypothetical protein
MYPCDGFHDVNTVCVLFLGDARDAYRGLPGLSRLSRVDHWTITRFSRGNLGSSLQFHIQILMDYRLLMIPDIWIGKYSSLVIGHKIDAQKKFNNRLTRRN